MKRIGVILTIIMLVVLVACKRSPALATFNEPQPANTENLSKFPNSLQGQYLSLEDKSILSIEGKLIERIYDFDYKVSQAELDSTFQLNGDTLIDIETNEKTIIKYAGDSLIVHYHHIDTLFQMDYDNVVRKFKGYFFLNTRYDKDSWEVKKMQLEKDQLIISCISMDDDIQKLKEITGTLQEITDTLQAIELPYNFTVTKGQFEQFVKNDGFSDRKIFIKQK